MDGPRGELKRNFIHEADNEELSRMAARILAIKDPEFIDISMLPNWDIIKHRLEWVINYKKLFGKDLSENPLLKQWLSNRISEGKLTAVWGEPGVNRYPMDPGSRMAMATVNRDYGVQYEGYPPKQTVSIQEDRAPSFKEEKRAKREAERQKWDSDRVRQLERNTKELERTLEESREEYKKELDNRSRSPERAPDSD